MEDQPIWTNRSKGEHYLLRLGLRST